MLAIKKLRRQISGFVHPYRKVKSRGIDFTMKSDNWITQFRWDTFNHKEPETLDWIDAYVGQAHTLFDVGANVGIYSMYAALKNRNLKVFSFEPEYSNLYQLRENIVKNNLGDQIDVYSIGLGSTNHVSRLHIQDMTPGAALHSESIENITVSRTGKKIIFREGIYCMTLDQFCEEENKIPSLLKIDVDGNELEVLKGGQEILRNKDMRSLIMEVQTEPKYYASCAKILKEAGLRLVSEKILMSTEKSEIWLR